MKIVLSYNETGSYLQRSTVLWKNAAQKQFRALLVLMAIGVLLLLAGFWGPGTFKSDLYKGTGLNNLNLSFSFGISVIFLSLAFLNALQKNKKKFFAAVTDRVKRAEACGNTITTVTITNTSITTADFEITAEAKWSAFSFYKVNDGYVLLYFFQNTPSYLVELDKLGDDERKAFEIFLKENLRFKK
jgi:hypothetical protein